MLTFYVGISLQVCNNVTYSNQWPHPVGGRGRCSSNIETATGAGAEFFKWGMRLKKVGANIWGLAETLILLG